VVVVVVVGGGRGCWDTAGSLKTRKEGCIFEWSRWTVTVEGSLKGTQDMPQDAC
jgi:hypothetical protein